jgi:hypothetical protein
MDRKSLIRLLAIFAVALTLALSSCASPPPCQCQTCEQRAMQCEQDLEKALDYVGRCQELLK